MARFISMDEQRAKDFQTSRLVKLRWNLDDVIALEKTNVSMQCHRLVQGVRNELMRIHRDPVHPKAAWPKQIIVQIPKWLRRYLKKEYTHLHVQCYAETISMSFGLNQESKTEDWDLANSGLIIAYLQGYARRVPPSPPRLGVGGRWRMRSMTDPVLVYPAVSVLSA